MLYINEFLPNPYGSDAEGEWVELYNDGPAEDLNGWFLERENGQKFFFKNRIIGEREFLVLRRNETKFALVNREGKIYLYNNRGELVHKAEFFGSAPEGKSFSRAGEGFIWSEPTPGVVNSSLSQLALIKNSYPSGQVLNLMPTYFSFLEIMLGSALLLTGFAIFILKRNESLSDLFFKRDEKIGF